MRNIANDRIVDIDPITTPLLASVCVAKTDLQNILLRVPFDVKNLWITCCQDRRVSQTVAGEALIKWFVQQDPLLQMMVLGAIPERPEVVKAAFGKPAADQPMKIAAKPRGPLPPKF